LVEEARESGPLMRPNTNQVRGLRLSHRERELANNRLKDLKEWRKSIGEELEVDPSLLWPTASLARLSRFPDKFSEERLEPAVRNWQFDEFGESLSRCLDQI
jgi:hypothetical protein